MSVCMLLYIMLRTVVRIHGRYRPVHLRALPAQVCRFPPSRNACSRAFYVDWSVGISKMERKCEKCNCPGRGGRNSNPAPQIPNQHQPPGGWIYDDQPIRLHLPTHICSSTIILWAHSHYISPSIPTPLVYSLYLYLLHSSEHHTTLLHILAPTALY